MRGRSNDANWDYFSTPLRRVVNIGRHYWCPVGDDNDVKDRESKAFVATFAHSIPSVASSVAFRVVPESSSDMGLLSDDCSSVYGGLGVGRCGRNYF